MKDKIYSSGLILIIASFIAVFLPGALQSCNPDRILYHTFLIPSNYEGTLRIIFDEDCGIKPKVENGRQILKFPKNGVLILNTSADSETGNEYYLIDDKGNKTKVNQILNVKERVIKLPAIVVRGVGVSSSVVNSTNSKVARVAGGATYIDFNLYNKDTTEIVNSIASQHLDSLTNVAVNACRADK